MSELTELLQTMYTCKKCGNDCEVEPDPGGHYGYFYAYCHECEDVAGGWLDGPCDEASREFVADQIDAARDQAKYSKLSEAPDAD